jgi:hypothetical protein
MSSFVGLKIVAGILVLFITAYFLFRQTWRNYKNASMEEKSSYHLVNLFFQPITPLPYRKTSWLGVLVIGIILGVLMAIIGAL